MKKIVLFFIILFNFINLFGQSTKEELKECTSQKFYINDFKGSIECLNKLINLHLLLAGLIMGELVISDIFIVFIKARFTGLRLIS